jgi:hypothetical protein
MKFVKPLLIGGAAIGTTYLLAKGVSVSKAAEDIDYKLAVKNFRIHKVSLLPFAVDTRFALDIKLTNPTTDNFKISHPDVIIKYNGQEIGRSTIKNKVYELNKRSEETIKDIEFSIDLSYLSNEFSDILKQIKSGWEAGKGLVYNLNKANETLSKYEDTILKHLTAKVNLIINRIPVSYEDTLAGGRSFGKIALGYAPISAIDRTIKACPECDKYFPVPKGKKELMKRNADVFQTVSLMIDVVEQDHKLIREASHKIFKKKTIEDTARFIFDWIFKHIKYDLEIGEQLRNPSTTYHLAQRLARKHYKEKGYYSKDLSADCDDISIFIASILRNLNIPYLFRIADYTGSGYSHVYTLIPRKGKKPIIIDPVYHAFNSEKTYVNEKTFDMNKNELSGIDVFYLSGMQNMNLGNIEEDTYEYLIRSRKALAEHPEQYSHISNPNTLIKLYDYAIQYWNTPERDTALSVLEQAENNLSEHGYIKTDGIAGIKDSKFFKKLKTLVQNIRNKKHVDETTKSNYAENPKDNFSTVSDDKPQ